MYLTPIDYTTLLREDVREMIEGEDTSKLPRAEAAAYGFMRHTWNKRYAVSEIFIPCPEHLVDQAYSEGQLVYWRPDEDSDYKVYTALQGNSTAPSNAADWSASDPRDQYVLELLVTLTVYNFFKSEASHAVPEIIKDMRMEARKDVIAIGAGERLADLPLSISEDESSSGDIRWKSQPKENNRW